MGRVAISVFDLFSIGIGPSSLAHGRADAGRAHVRRPGSTTDGAARARSRGCGSSCSARSAPPARARQRPGGDPRPRGRGAGDGRHRLGRRAGRRGAGEPGRVALLGKHEVALRRRRPGAASARELPFHPNGMRFYALDGADEPVLRERTYYSVGGGFVVDEAGGRRGPDQARRHRSCRYPFTTGDELLDALRRVRPADQRRDARERDRPGAPEAEIRAGLLEIWAVMQECVQQRLRARGHPARRAEGAAPRAGAVPAAVRPSRTRPTRCGSWTGSTCSRSP